MLTASSQSFSISKLATQIYLLLPEGVLRGRTVGQILAGNDVARGSVWLEWLRILAINLGVMLLLIILPNIFQSKGDYPLGYNT